MGPEFRKSPLVSRQWTRSLCQDVILGVTNARDQMHHSGRHRLWKLHDNACSFGASISAIMAHYSAPTSTGCSG
jgi:hypothetical protein